MLWRDFTWRPFGMVVVAVVGAAICASGGAFSWIVGPAFGGVLVVLLEPLFSSSLMVVQAAR